jgi:hypothetical protein
MRLARLWENTQLWYWTPWSKSSFSNTFLMESPGLQIPFHEHNRQGWPYYQSLRTWKLTLEYISQDVPINEKPHIWMVNNEPRRPFTDTPPLPSFFSQLKLFLGFN